MGEYIVLWRNNSRIASIDHTRENLEHLHAHFNLGLIQRDITGTEHYEVYGINRGVNE